MHYFSVGRKKMVGAKKGLQVVKTSNDGLFIFLIVEPNVDFDTFTD